MRAEAAYRQVISLAPGIAAAHNNLGTVLKDKDLPDEALAAFETAIRLNEDYAEAFYNRGTVLQQQARLEEALTAYGRAIGLRDGYADAMNNAGIVLQQLGRAGEAVELYRRLLQRMPDHAAAYNNMGTALLALGNADKALAAFEQALARQPDFPEAFYNLGNAWRELGDLTEAIAAYRNALRLRPGYADAFSQLVYHRALACEWTDREAEQERLIEMVRAGSSRSAILPALDPGIRIGSTDLCPAMDQARSTPPPQAVFGHAVSVETARIRIGYLSGDFHQHATARLMAELFERHDRDRFEVFAYSYGPDDGSPMRARLQSAFDRFVDIHARSHREAAEHIHGDKIDILIDLKGYTHQARPAISAYRPAPVQVSYLGYPATMGADFIDYIMVDPCGRPGQPASVLFGKARPSSRLLSGERHEARGGASVPRGSPADCPPRGWCFAASTTATRYRRRFSISGCACCGRFPAAFCGCSRRTNWSKAICAWRRKSAAWNPSRLVFAPVVLPAEHLGRHQHADLFLDTLPCNAHTTASDALWAGLPVLTCRGDTFAGRVAGSLLTAVGMPELVTGSLEEYEQAALDLARAPQRLIALRQKLQENRDTSPLFDLPKLTGNIEAAYQRMWQTWRSQQKPAAFAIEST